MVVPCLDGRHPRSRRRLIEQMLQGEHFASQSQREVLPELVEMVVGRSEVANVSREDVAQRGPSPLPDRRDAALRCARPAWVESGHVAIVLEEDSMFEPTIVAPSPTPVGGCVDRGRAFQVKRKIDRNNRQACYAPRLGWHSPGCRRKVEVQAGAVPAIDRSVLESLNLRWRNTAFFARIERATRGSS